MRKHSRSRIAAALAAALALAGAAPAAARDFPDARQPAPVADQWLVELSSPPAAQYRGGAGGLAATAPQGAGKLAPKGAAVRDYARYLDGRADAVLAAAAPGVKPDVRYRYAFAGFAAKLSDAEAAALRNQPGVRAVTRETFLETLAQPGGGVGGSEADALGLPGGLWKRLGGAADAGRGTIVGVVDTGITPESDAFKDKGMAPPAVWNGACEAGEQFPASTCNNKLIGARWFLDGLISGSGGDVPEGAILSPRDDDGHGTHVAASAVGDKGVDPVIGGNGLGVDRLTGIAPAAYLAVYKACSEGVCSNVDIVSAIDAAVADGVDVLNLSLGGPVDPRNPVDPVEVALLNADAAGVFVAVAAGNAGASEGAIGSPAAAPWTTAVAATTGTRTFRTRLDVTGAGHASVPASGVASGLADAPLADAATFGPRTDDVTLDPRYCYDGFTAAQVRGKVVICEGFAPLDLLESTLHDDGALGLVLVVADGTADAADAGVIPTVFIKPGDADAVHAALDGGPGTVTFGAAAATPWPADRVADFSSRGPSTVTHDLLRPDVAAPGVDVLSAFPLVNWLTQYGGVPQERFAVESGTSMASPQVAGVGALLTQLHPRWSSAAIRSALVTTAAPASDGGAPASPVAVGGGRVDPQAAADAELVVAPTADEYRRYAAGIEPGSVDAAGDPIAPRDLNLPSISLDGAGDTVTVQRTVTDVASARGEFHVSVQGTDYDGLDARVTPNRFTLAPGQSQTLTIELAAFNGTREFRPGAVVLHDTVSGRDTRLPLAIRDPGVFDPPAQLALDAGAADGAKGLDVRIAGQVSALGYGLAAPEVEHGVPADHAEAAGFLYSHWKLVHVPAGTSLLSVQGSWPDSLEAGFAGIYRDGDHDGRFSVADEDVGTFSDGDPGRSDVVRPPAGDYIVRVGGISPAPFDIDLSTWLVTDPQPDDPAPAPGLVVDGDASVWPAGQHTFTARWNGVSGDQPLRGVIAWVDGDHPLADTVVQVAPPGVTPPAARPVTAAEARRMGM